MSLIPRGFLVAQCDRCQLMLEVDGSEIVFDDINEAVSYMNDREWIVVHEYGEGGAGAQGTRHPGSGPWCKHIALCRYLNGYPAWPKSNAPAPVPASALKPLFG